MSITLNVDPGTLSDVLKVLLELDNDLPSRARITHLLDFAGFDDDPIDRAIKTMEEVVKQADTPISFDIYFQGKKAGEFAARDRDHERRILDEYRRVYGEPDQRNRKVNGEIQPRIKM